MDTVSSLALIQKCLGTCEKSVPRVLPCGCSDAVSLGWHQETEFLVRSSRWSDRSFTLSVLVVLKFLLLPYFPFTRFPWALSMLVCAATSCVSVHCTAEPSAQLPFIIKVRHGGPLLESASCVFHRLLRGNTDLILFPNQLFGLVPYLLMARVGNRTGVSTFILPSFFLLQGPTSWCFHPNSFHFFLSLSSPPVSLPSF